MGKMSNTEARKQELVQPTYPEGEKPCSIYSTNLS